MNEQQQKEEKIKNYRSIISAVLTYPDKVTKILEANKKNIDSEFVDVVKEVSERMAAANNQKAATFLRDLANKLRREYNIEVLKVNEEQIGANEIITRLVKYKMLPKFLSEIIIDQAIAPITCSAAEKNQVIQNFYQENQLKDEKDIREWCEKNGLTQEQIEELAMRQLKIQKFQKNNFEPQLETYFLQQKDKLDQVAYSMIRTQDGKLAQELYFRLKEGEQSFAELAKKYSTGPEAQNGGIVGPIAMNMPHPTIAKMLKASKPGQLWKPTKVGEWFIIVRLEKFIPAGLNNSMRQRMLNEMFQNWISKQLNELEIKLNPETANSQAQLERKQQEKSKEEGLFKAEKKPEKIPSISKS